MSGQGDNASQVLGVEPSRAVNAASPTERSNAFDVLRCLLAAAVLYSHTFFLGGYPPESFHQWSKGQAIIAELAVLGFFGLSGFLVTASYTRSSSLVSYLGKRARRILPGYWVCILVTAFVFAPTIFFFRHHSLAGFPWAGSESALTFAAKNIGINIRQWGIGGVLDGASYNGSLNGSLWSLWPETLCYLILAALGLGHVLDRNRPLLLVGIGSLMVLNTAHRLLPDVASPILPTWLTLTDRAPYFLAYFVGAALWIWRDQFKPNWMTGLLLLFALAASARLGGLQILAPVFVPLAVVVIGQCFTFHLRDDVSYGLYIYGFPVQQLLAATALRNLPAPVFLAASFIVTFICAFLSWRFVERPFLRRATQSPAIRAPIPAYAAASLVSRPYDGSLEDK
jgi:peptidoglycan/LPS O-acetylase OafA/YrhL